VCVIIEWILTVGAVIQTGKNRSAQKKLKAVPLPHRPPQIPHGLAPEIQPGPPRCWDIPLAPKLFSPDPQKLATNSQGIRGYIYGIAALKLAYILIKRMTFVNNNRGTSVIGYVLFRAIVRISN